MPMPPTVNPYDPRKNRLQQSGTQAQPQQQAQPAAPVQSNLQPMPQAQPQGQQPVVQAGQPQQATQVEKKKPAAPVTYQQQAGAVADPRFSQALAQKLQSDVAAKQAQLQQQQAKFQEELTKAGTGVAGSSGRISDILNKIQSGTASDADLAEYQKIQTAEYQGPQGLDGAANIAALSQLAGSPQLLAQQYAGFAPGGVSAGDFQRAMAGLQTSPQLAAAQEAATGLATQASSAEEVAAQQAALLKGQTEAAKQEAETGIKAKQAEYMGQLGEASKADVEAKKSALDRLKAGIFMGQKINQADLQKLGLSKEDLSSLKGLDVSQVEGIGEVKSVEDLNKAIETLNKKATEEGEEALTPEQQRLRGMFQDISGLTREGDTAAGYGYAKKEDLAKINALRKLTGQSTLTEEDLAKGFESGKISKDTLSGLIGRQRAFEGKYTGQEDVEKSLGGKEQRLSGGTWYKGGLNKASEDLKKADFKTNPTQATQTTFGVAASMMTQMNKSGTKENNLYKWLQKNLGKMQKDPNVAKEFIKKVNQNKKSYSESVSGKKATLSGMSDISKALDIE